MKIICLLSAVIFLSAGLSPISANAAESSGEQRLEELRKNWEKARWDYRTALKSEMESKDNEILQKEDTLTLEADIDARKKLIQDSKNLREERELLNEKIRAINASDVVRFSDSKHKLAALFTHAQ